ncbi:hypothetical protein AOLI_G00154650 [Acnodon oligacanthus]
MRLQATLALICVLFSKALTLECYECIPNLFGPCTETKTDCPDQCDSKTMVMNMGGLQHEVDFKKCAAADECDTRSINFGAMKITINSKCCSTDLCNSQKVPALPEGSPNGKKCYTCDDKDCSGTLSCVGNEDHCIIATGAFSMEEAGIKGDLSCCEGNLCNSAAGVRLSLLMLVPSLSTILFF